MKKAFSPVKIVQNGNMDGNGKICFEVENRHLFSNLNETKIEWSAGNETGTVYANLEPGEKGKFEITIPEEARTEKHVDLKVTGVRGFEVDAYRFQTLPQIHRTDEAKKTGKVGFSETVDAYKINLGDASFNVCKRNGLFTAYAKGKEVLLKAPELMVLPLNAEGEGIQMVGKDQKFEPYTPACTRWAARKIELANVNRNEVKIRVYGEYNEAEGYFDYVFKGTGEVECGYSFTMLEAVSPRQTGLVFTAPSSFDKVRWKRIGYWNVYPEDHIGALEGEAEAHDASMPISGLAGPSAQPTKAWGYDQTASGSNLFRATKENIFEAELCNEKETSIMVLSDGTQHLRPWKAENGIYFLVADYNNAGNDTFLTSHSSKDFRPLKRGDKTCGKVVLTIKP